MARLHTDVPVKTLRRRIPGLVFRDYGDKIVVSGLPAKSTKPRTEAQQQQGSKLAAAVPYARQAIADREGRAYYSAAVRRAGGNPFSKAVGDHMVPPTVDVIDAAAFDRRAGDVIWVDASDNVGVVRVTVEIADTDGVILDQGEARPTAGRWRYPAGADVPSAATVTARAWDRPGNTAEATAELPPLNAPCR